MSELVNLIIPGMSRIAVRCSVGNWRGKPNGKIGTAIVRQALDSKLNGTVVKIEDITTGKSKDYKIEAMTVNTKDNETILRISHEPVKGGEE